MKTKIFFFNTNIIIYFIIFIFLAPPINKLLNYLNFNIDLSSFLNYLALIIAVYYNFFINRKIGIWSVFLFFVTILFTLFNFLFTDYSNFKSILIWISFTYISIIFAEIFKHLQNNEIKRMQQIFYKSIKLILFLLVVAFLILLITEGNKIEYYLLENRNWNVINSIFFKFTNISKQLYGILTALLIISYFNLYKKFSFNRKIIILTSFIILLPTLISIRTLWLSLFLLVFMNIIFRFNSLSQYKFIILASFTIVVIFYIFGYDYELLSYYYNRLPSIIFSLDFLEKNIFGIGYGGYTIYVEQNMRTLTNEFSNNYFESGNQFWLAPESDVALLIGSFGIISLFYLFFIIFLIINSFKLLKKFKHQIFDIEKIFIYFAACLLFMGLTQDNVASLIWWLFVGISSGVLMRYRKAHTRIHENK